MTSDWRLYSQGQVSSDNKSVKTKLISKHRNYCQAPGQILTLGWDIGMQTSDQIRWIQSALEQLLRNSNK